MNPAQAQALRELLQRQRIAALGTLHGGEPYVSMAPLAMLPGGELVIHVSHLSAHTKDMLENPRVSILVMAAESNDVLPQATPRVTIQGQAAQCEAGTAPYDLARSAYLTRFPEATEILAVPGFSFFVIRPISIRLIGGFAQAVTLTPADLAAAVSQP